MLMVHFNLTEFIAFPLTPHHSYALLWFTKLISVSQFIHIICPSATMENFSKPLEALVVVVLYVLLLMQTSATINKVSAYEFTRFVK